MCIVVWRLSVFGSRGSISLWPTGAIWMLLIGLIYTAYFIGLGTIATVIAASMAGVSSAWTNYPLIVGVVSVAWLVGLVTPGAPAGLGVRETVVVIALGRTNLANESLLIALGLRIARLGGDALLAIAAQLADDIIPRLWGAKATAHFRFSPQAVRLSLIRPGSPATSQDGLQHRKSGPTVVIFLDDPTRRAS